MHHIFHHVSFPIANGEGMKNMREITVLNNLVTLNSDSFDLVPGPWDEHGWGMIEMHGGACSWLHCSAEQAHFTIIRGHPWRSVEIWLIKTKCFIKSQGKVSSSSKINSQQFPEIHILISILLKPPTNGGSLHCKRTCAIFPFFFYSSLLIDSHPVCVCGYACWYQQASIGFKPHPW